MGANVLSCFGFLPVLRADDKTLIGEWETIELVLVENDINCSQEMTNGCGPYEVLKHDVENPEFINVLTGDRRDYGTQNG